MRDSEGIKSLPSWEDWSKSEEMEGEDEPEYRAELVEALYSSSGIAGAALTIEKLVAHCSNVRDTSKEMSHQNVERAKKERPRGPLKQSDIAQATLTDSLPAPTPKALNQSSDISPRLPLAPQPPDTRSQQWGGAVRAVLHGTRSLCGDHGLRFNSYCLQQKKSRSLFT
jgi:hypothetical protein